MMAQFGPGKARQGDDARLRREWFWQCLGRMESRKPRFKQLAFPENIGCGLAGGDWSIYKEMIRTFARRNRDIRVDIIQLLSVDDSESDSSDPSDWTDQDRTPILTMTTKIAKKNRIRKMRWMTKITTKEITMVAKITNRTTLLLNGRHVPPVVMALENSVAPMKKRLAVNGVMTIQPIQCARTRGFDQF